MINTFKSKIVRWTRSRARFFNIISPNALTLLGSIPPILFFIFMVKENYTLALLLFPLFMTDLLDGAIARARGKVTAFGGFLDSTVDRISDFLLISAFGFGKIIRFEIVVLLLCSAFLVSYTRSIGELAGDRKVSFAHGLMERTERVIGILITLIALLIIPLLKVWSYNIPEIIFGTLTILSLVTVLQRVLYAFNNL